MAEPISYSFDGVDVHQLPKMTQPALTSEDMTDRGNGPCDDGSNILQHHKLLQSASKALQISAVTLVGGRTVTRSREDGLYSFIKYLELIKSKAKDFIYQRARCSDTASESGKKKLLGILWQTATIQCNFELCGDRIGLDMMNWGSIDDETGDKYIDVAIFFSGNV